MKFLLRVDDVGWTGEEDVYPLKKPDRKGVVMRRFHEALDGVPYLAAVIPNCIDLTSATWIKEKAVKTGMTVALHGYSHKEPKPGDRHEFEGFPNEKVREAICAGQRIIGPTTYYVAPFNSFASSHIESMWHEGIRYIFGREQDWPTPPSPSELAMGVKFIPAWSRIYGALGWVQGSAKKRILDEIDELADQPGIAVMTLHLPWSVARDPEFKHERSLSKNFKKLFITPEKFVAEIK